MSKSKKKNKINKETKIIILFLALITIIISAITIYFNITYTNKIFPNISINNEDYSGLTKEQAFLKLENKIKNIYQDDFSFTYEDDIFKTVVLETGITIDINKTINDAFYYGHHENILQSVKEQIILINKKKDFQVKIITDEKKFEDYLQKELSKIETPPKNFGYEYLEEEFAPTVPESGIVINRSKLKKDIVKNLFELKNNDLKIELITREAEIKKDLNNRALTQANNLLSKKIFLKYNSDKFEVQKEDLALWIKFDAINDANNKNKRVLGIMSDDEKIKDYLLTFIVPQVNREPTNAQLEFENKRVEVFSLSQEGISVKVEESKSEIIKNVFRTENYKDDLEKNIEIEIITEKIQPDITTESIDNMGITALLATGESNFYGSPKNRIHNITVGASKFNGILVGPEDEFSFNKALGKVGPKQGYLPELVIKKGVTTPEYGGGLCQVSTTAFRAAVTTGLKITERKNHAYPVKYYNPQGTDATIYPPHPDLRFKNNTAAYILIQTRIEGNKLYFDFYGSDDGREVVLTGPYIYDKKANGAMKATWTQEVYNKNGELDFKEIFYSNYKSPALYPRGTPL
ncbi:VanW family protein [Candidatus Parcubacteria bacterium]|nr:VanW family protein [Candidatus Parcubacteria bacterium]